jgi:hypothetical protein
MACATFCGCSGTIRNTGVPNRQLKIEDGNTLIIVPLVADDGTENKVLRSDTLNQAYFQAKVNATDPSKRWYPIGTFVNVTNERGESNYETFSDGTRARTYKAPRTFTGYLLNYAPAYAATIESLRCVKVGAYLVDDCGQLIGSFCPDATTPANDALKPIPLNEASIDSLVMLQSDAAAGKVQMSVDFDQLFKDQTLRVLTSEEAGDANLLNLTKLQPTITTISGESTTGFVAAIELDYDSWTAVPIEGLVLADFYLYNESTASAITITSVTETPTGTYTFVIPAQSSTDVLTLSQSSTTTKPFGVSASITIP